MTFNRMSHHNWRPQVIFLNPSMYRSAAAAKKFDKAFIVFKFRKN